MKVMIIAPYIYDDNIIEFTKNRKQIFLGDDINESNDYCSVYI